MVCLRTYAQDTLQRTRTLQGVDVKGVRMEPLTSKAAMPVTVISKKTLDMMGSRRLDEVLREQTGLAVVSDIGSGSRAVGLQMQGFSSAYIMVLIDGQPMIGRNGGNFDLSRITVSEIERIEIVKGASSCLFGSEALGGVINIITKQRMQNGRSGMAQVRYGTQNNTDITLEGEAPFAAGKADASLSLNYFHTDGFNVNPYLTKGVTAPPYNSYSMQGRMRYVLSPVHTLSFTGRGALRTSLNESVYGTGVAANKDKLNESDINASVALLSAVSNNWKLKTQYYFTRYASDQRVSSDKVTLQRNEFSQYFHRLEVQSVNNISNSLSLTGGLGGNLETMAHNEYSNGNTMTAAYAYLQGDWKPGAKADARLGFRYDHNSYYGGRFNPSIGFNYTPASFIMIKAAVGTGYKTPGFKERFQVFTNPQAGYTVAGVEEVARVLADMQANGKISEIRPIAKTISNDLKPETSVSYNLGITLTPFKSVKAEVSGFYNDLNNFINTVQVATQTNFQPVWSYINLERSFTGGMEANLGWNGIKGLEVSGGYQLLYAKDKGMIDSIKSGKYPYNKVRNNETGETRNARPSDYVGLENRSRHMGNLRIFYEYQPWAMNATFRVQYRGKAGYDDANNNRFLDKYDTFIDGYYLLNASLEKKLFAEKLSIQLTVDNLMDYTDMLMPAQPGRIIMLGAKWRLMPKRPRISTINE